VVEFITNVVVEVGEADTSVVVGETITGVGRATVTVDGIDVRVVHGPVCIDRTSLDSWDGDRGGMRRVMGRAVALKRDIAIVRTGERVRILMPKNKEMRNKGFELMLGYNMGELGIDAVQCMQ